MKRLYCDYSKKNHPEAELLSETQDQGVIPRAWVENRMVMPSGALESFKFINKEDFAISLRSFEGGLEYCHHDGTISPAYTILKKERKQIDIQNAVTGKSLNHGLDGLKDSTENQKSAKSVDYINTKFAKIDRAISLQQTQIAKLKEYKAKLIDSAVRGKIKIN